MAFNLRNRSLLNMQDFTPRDIRFLLDLAAELKRAKYAGNEVARLNGKNIALIFEKTSTRTRCAFEVAVHDQGGKMPFKTCIIKPLAALITLSCGGSAGKEGPCSHIGASLAAGIGHVLKLNSELQRRIVAQGLTRHPVLAVRAVQVAAEHAKGQRIPPGEGMIKRLLLDGIDPNRRDIPRGHH